MSEFWSLAEEALLVENLELGHDLELIAAVLEKPPIDVAVKMIHLYQNGTLVVMAGPTFEVFVKRMHE